ncbi:hypothetical protein IHN32_11695 [Deinococcus sp. 14RED07]|uniref:hypothetical protein n=1 Tax=Deinococcus sp. 14RED07 TaxID=2745874 RepID=UPI001E3F87DD|nr:hypothetical protein [Deinococcus sp. 14RED07]MCD0176604.1 hypothetical protein [Deinococcus sp. 14RED07]
MTQGNPYPPASNATPAEHQRHTALLHEHATRLLTLKRSITELRGEADDLTEQVKALLSAGYRTTVLDQRPVLRPSYRRVIAFSAFRQQFGDKLTYQCLTIDVKAVDALVQRGVITKADAERVTTRVQAPPALYWAAAQGRRA